MIRRVAGAAILGWTVLGACGGEIPLQIVEGELDLAALGEAMLLVQARDEDERLQAVSPTEPDGYFVLFVPPGAGTLFVTASGRAVHELGSLRVCEVGPPHRMEVDGSSTRGSELSEACFEARAELSACRREVQLPCEGLEAEVFACRRGEEVPECVRERAALAACDGGPRECEAERLAAERCRQSECDERLARFLDAGCLDACDAREEQVATACAIPPRQGVVMELGCS